MQLLLLSALFSAALSSVIPPPPTNPGADMAYLNPDKPYVEHGKGCYGPNLDPVEHEIAQALYDMVVEYSENLRVKSGNALACKDGYCIWVEQNMSGLALKLAAATMIDQGCMAMKIPEDWLYNTSSPRMGGCIRIDRMNPMCNDGQGGRCLDVDEFMIEYQPSQFCFANHPV